MGSAGKPGLFYVPGPLLSASLRATRQAEMYAPLFGSLVADPSALQRLDWQPPAKPKRRSPRFFATWKYAALQSKRSNFVSAKAREITAN